MPNGQGTIDDKVKAGTTNIGGGIFDSISKSIEDLVTAVREIPKTVKEAAYYTYYGTKAALGLAAGVAIAGYNALILPVGMAFGAGLANWKNKEKKTFKETYKQMANELAIGGILGGLLHHIFVGSNKLGNIVKSAYGTAAGLLTKGGCALAQMPVFLGSHEYLNRALISDYKPKPLKNMWKQIKGMWPIIPPIMANFTVVPEYLGHSYQMPVAAGVSVAYGLLKAEPKKEEKKEAQPDYNQLAKAMQQQYRGVPRPG